MLGRVRVHLSSEAMDTSRTECGPQLRTVGERAVWAILCLSWKVIRFPAVAILIILEPVVRLLLAGFALLLTLSALFLKLAMPPGAHVPFLGMLALAVGCTALLSAYYWILRVLSA
jgi:hypothetical protein